METLLRLLTQSQVHSSTLTKPDSQESGEPQDAASGRQDGGLVPGWHASRGATWISWALGDPEVPSGVSNAERHGC